MDTTSDKARVDGGSSDRVEVAPFFDADKECYHVPQCGSWNLQTLYYNSEGVCTGVSRSYGLSFNTKEAAQDRADLETVWQKVYLALNLAWKNGYEKYTMDEPVEQVVIDLLYNEPTLEDAKAAVVQMGVETWRTNKRRAMKVP